MSEKRYWTVPLGWAIVPTGGPESGEAFMLHEFITENRAEIIAMCRLKVAARPTPRPTPAELKHGVPLFLDQLAEILRLHTKTSTVIRDSAILHGDELQRLGFTVR